MVPHWSKYMMRVHHFHKNVGMDKNQILHHGYKSTTLGNKYFRAHSFPSISYYIQLSHVREYIPIFKVGNLFYFYRNELVAIWHILLCTQLSMPHRQNRIIIRGIH